MENYTVVNQPSKILIGIECRTSNASDAGPLEIPKLWERFYREDIINQIPHKTSNDVIALYCDYESDHTNSYTIIIGCQVSFFDAIPHGMVAKIIPSSSYALFRAIGEHPKSLIETWGSIWQQTALKRTYTGDYEVYGEKFNGESTKEVEVFIAIE